MAGRIRKFEVTADSLAGVSFFSHLGHDDRAHVARYCQGLGYQRGDEIIRYEATDRDVYFILSGRVRAELLKAAGETISLQDLGAGEMFGELSAMDGLPRSTSVIALDEARLVQIPGAGFRDLLERHPSLSQKVILRLCGLSRHLSERAKASVLSVPDRIRLEVWRIVQEHSQGADGAVVVESPPTHEEIGHFVDTRREQVTRVLNDYPETVIERSRKRWVVHDVDAVREMAPSV